MQRQILFILLLISPLLGLSQEQKKGTISLKKAGCEISKDDPLVYTRVDSMPDFPGGGKEGDRWMRRNLYYPPEAMAKGLSGTVWVSFVVMPDGSLARTKILSSDNKVFHDEVMRLVLAMPKWKPGKCGNTAVPVEFRLPMKFQLQ
jgi:TonB family protein